MQERMSDYAASLIQEICGGQIAERLEAETDARVKSNLEVELRTLE